MVKIKICGLTRPVDIEAVNEFLPDYIGFIFAKSRRQIKEEKAEELKGLLRPEIKAVGVFVNAEVEFIQRLCNSDVIDLVQLHGDEDEAYCKRLKAYIDKPIIKAVRVRTEEDVKKAEDFPSDYLLFDAYREDQYGGSGEVFNWNVIVNIKKPFFLAGGIQIDNVERAIRLCSPNGIDVSSGVETEGWKDCRKIQEMITKIRSVK